MAKKKLNLSHTNPVVRGFLIIIFITAIIFRLPSLFEPYWYGDENIYLVMGQALRKGLVFYKEIHDNKPPLLYLLAALTGNVFSFRLLLLVWHLLTIYLFWKLCLLLFKKEKIVFILTLVFTIFSTIPLLEGNIANAEIFMLLPTIGAMWLLAKSQKLKAKSYFWAGILFSLAFLFKVPAGFDFCAAFLFFLIFQEKNLKTILKKSWWQKALPLLTGFLLPITLSLFYYFLKGSLLDYIRACFSQNVGYLSTWKGETGFLQGQGRLLIRTGILLILLLILYLKKNRLDKRFLLPALWSLFSLFAALLSERPYPHYLIQVLPAAILLLGLIFEKKLKEKALILFTFGILLLAFYYYNFYTYPVFSYYKNFLLFATGQRDKEAYFNAFDAKTNQTYQIAFYLKTHTLLDERVFIWGNEPGIHALSHRLPVGKYMVAYHIVHFNGFKETMESLKEKMPNFIIKMSYEERPFKEFDIFLNQYYIRTTIIGQAEIYHKIFTI